MVTTNVPRESELEPWNVSVEVPVPPDDTVTLAGLKVSVTPLTADADSDTVPLKPFRLVIVIVVDVEPNLDIEALEGETLMLKSGVAGAVTVSEIVVE
jgi:hypothetical protein